MPKTKLAKFANTLKKPDINSVEMLVHAYMRAGELDSDSVGEKIGLTGSGFRSLLAKPMESWTLGEIRKTCSAVNCPVSEIYLDLYNRSITE